jgi:hypothetical protein
MHSRQAECLSLISNSHIGLINQKETQDRTRKRIKEDLKASTIAHTDFAENTLPKVKRAYLKKCQEFEVKMMLYFAPHLH